MTLHIRVEKEGVSKVRFLAHPLAHAKITLFSSECKSKRKYAYTFLFLRHKAFDVFAENADTLGVLATLRNDDVGITLGGLDELLVHGLEHLQITFYDHRHGAPAVDGVALNVANEPLVGVAIDKYPEIHEIAQLLVEQCHDALDDDNRLRFHMDGFRETVALYVGIGGLLDGPPLPQVVDLPMKQFPVESVGMVEIDGMTLLLGHVGRVVVIGVEWHYSHKVRREGLHDFPDHGRLAGAGASGNAYDSDFIIHISWVKELSQCKCLRMAHQRKALAET